VSATLVPDDYLAARLAYGAADALVTASTYAATPVLSREAPPIRAAAIRQLREAIAALEADQ
jgi:hypothetical protein